MSLRGARAALGRRAWGRVRTLAVPPPASSSEFVADLRRYCGIQVTKTINHAPDWLAQASDRDCKALNQLNSYGTIGVEG